MNKERRITVYKSNNIIEKIRSFFTKIFHKSKYKDNNLTNFTEQENPYNNNNFKEQMVIKEDEEKLRLLKLQKDYENGLIEEENISQEDYQKLLDLYDEQNEKISKEIEKDRIEIKNMLQQLKKNAN